MIPPIEFITDIVYFLFYAIELFESNHNDNRSHIHGVNLSFINIIEIIVLLTNFMEIYFDNFLEQKHQWDAHKIITYLIGYW